MNKQKLISALVLMLAFNLTAAAGDIYKRTNADGVIEFSDRPSSDASKIEVNPNVVQTNPVAPRAPAASTTGLADETVSTDRQDAARRNADTEYARTTNRRERTEREESRKRNEGRHSREEDDREPIADPNPGRATRNAARAASGGR